MSIVLRCASLLTLSGALLSACADVRDSSDALGSSSTSLLDTEEYYSPSVNNEVALGFGYDVYINASSLEERDVLVDFLDSTGWYAGGRRTIPAGQTWGEPVHVQLPASVRDPKSTYFSMKVVPRGADWRSAVLEQNIPVELIAGTRIPVSFHFGGILDAYTSSFWRSNSNHDSYSAVLRRVEDGPFSGQYVLRTAYSGYGITDQQTLNLETGALAVMHGSYSDPEQTRTLAVPRAGEDPLPYVRGLNALEYALSFVATPGRGTSPFLQYPMLEPARGYVTSVFRTVLETNGPILKGPAESPALIAGLENSLALEVASEQERDLLVDLFVDGRWAAGARGPVQAGYAELSTPSFEVPSTVTRHMSGVVYLKLVPTGADWTKKVAEVAVPVTFRGPELLSWYIVSDGEGNEVVAPGAQVFVSGSIRAERVMDVRVDLFHPDGRWLSGAQGPTNSIPEWENTYNFEIAPVVPDSVPSGTQLTVITKVLPPGGLWSSYVDQSVRGIMVR